jgi:predicted Holliday junction resolvase-like endonuclease
MIMIIIIITIITIIIIIIIFIIIIVIIHQQPTFSEQRLEIVGWQTRNPKVRNSWVKRTKVVYRSTKTKLFEPVDQRVFCY